MAADNDPSDRTSRLAVQPGTIRGIPSFVFSIPEGWEVDEVPNALAVVRPPEPTDGFLSNLMIRHIRLGAGVDLKFAAEATRVTTLKMSPEATISFERAARFGETVVHLRGLSLVSPESQRRLGQLQGLCMAPKGASDKTVDLIQMVGTSLEDIDPSPAAQFMEVIGSLRFL
jgi:hypothetical protein